MCRNLVLVSCVLCVLVASPTLLSAQPGPPPVPQATVTVDCDAGDTLADGLATRATELTIEFTGTCTEELVINRDRLTIRGLDASATVTDDPSTSGFNPSFLLQGADVIFEGFTIDGSENRGIRAQQSSGILVTGLTVQNNGGTGLTIEESSSAHVIDSTFHNNVFAGVAVWGNSSLTLSGTLDVSGNGIVGLLVSTGSVVQNRNGTSIVVNGGVFGIATQIGATGQFPPLESDGTDFPLISFGGDYFGSVNATNSGIGIFLTNKGSFDGGADVSGAFGVLAEEDSTALIRGGAISAPTALSLTNGVVEADGVTFDGNIELAFNAQALFNGATTTGIVICAPSALAGGSISCPSPLLAETLRLDNPAAQQVELPHSLPLIQPE